MYTITLISTIHSENGLCTSDNLYRILEEINPQVIFDELPPNFSDMYYSDSFDIYRARNILLKQPLPQVPLEVNCNKKYLQNYNAEIIPVDIDTRDELSKHKDEFHFLFSVFFKNEAYLKLDHEKEDLISQKGFYFLNSSKYLEFLEEKEIVEMTIMETDNEKSRLLDIYKLFRTVQYDCRENAMLDNIYRYSKENKYDQAAFLIGAEHRNSIRQKIRNLNNNSEVKINWRFYGDK